MRTEGRVVKKEHTATGSCTQSGQLRPERSSEGTLKAVLHQGSDGVSREKNLSDLLRGEFK